MVYRHAYHSLASHGIVARCKPADAFISWARQIGMRRGPRVAEALDGGGVAWVSSAVVKVQAGRGRGQDGAGWGRIVKLSG